MVVPERVGETGGILLVSKRPEVHNIQLPRLEHVRFEAVTVQQLDQGVRILSQPECSDLDMIHDRWRDNSPSRNLRRHYRGHRLGLCGRGRGSGEVRRGLWARL